MVTDPRHFYATDWTVARAAAPSGAGPNVPPIAAPVRTELAPYAFAAAHELAAAIGCSHVLAQVLVRRGLGDPGAARQFLEARVSHPRDAFPGLGVAAGRLLEHVTARRRITVHGDYDVDGICSTAVLVRALRTLGADVDWYLPSRIDDGYGLARATVERLAARGTEVLVTVDCAITAVEEVALARELGLDVIVTDHHSPRADGRLPDAPIVHPGVAGYPCPELCAAAVAHKLAGALLAAAGEDPSAADEDLDLVALATVADVVPLVDENRRLVREGMRALANTRKPGLRALMDVAHVDPGRVDERAIGFRLGPRLNAAGRLHRADAGLELLLTDDRDRAVRIAAELDAINADRRDVETRIRFAAEALVSETGPAPAYVLAGEGWHPGVIGIVASRIAERHHRPTVLIALDSGHGTGSGRSIPGFDLLGGLNACARHLERHGGHRAAAGLTITAAAVDGFREAFVAHAADVLTPEDLTRRVRVDAVASGDALSLTLAEELESLAPFGMGNPEVSLLVPAAELSEPRELGEGRHVAFTLAGGGARSRCVRFGQGGTLPTPAGAPTDAVVRLEINHYNGSVEPRLVLRSAEPCAPAPITVLGEPPDYLAAVLAELDRPLAGAPDGPPPDPAAALAARLGAALASGLASARPPATAPIVPQTARALAPSPIAPHTRATGGARTVRDVRGSGIAGVLGDLVASGEPVLAVCAHAQHRARVLAPRLGGFALCSWAALAGDPELAAPYRHVVAVDPPAATVGQHVEGAGFTHLAWGPAELRFASEIHEWDYAVRDPLADLYRALRAMGGLGGEALTAVLRGTGAQPRSAALAGRLVRVLVELDLVVLDRAGPTLAAAVDPAPPARTSLDRSPAFRAYQRTLEDGRRWLSTPTATQTAA